MEMRRLKKKQKENRRIRASLPVGGQSWPWRDELDGGIERTEEEESQLEYKRSGRDGNWFCIDYHNRSHLFIFYFFSLTPSLHQRMPFFTVSLRSWLEEVGEISWVQAPSVLLIHKVFGLVFMNLVITFFKCNQSQSPINWTLAYLKHT